jgi:hypothetical protein
MEHSISHADRGFCGATSTLQIFSRAYMAEAAFAERFATTST